MSSAKRVTGEGAVGPGVDQHPLLVRRANEDAIALADIHDLDADKLTRRRTGDGTEESEPAREDNDPPHAAKMSGRRHER